MEEIMNDKWISIDEAAEYLGIKTVTLRSWIRNGKEGLPAQKSENSGSLKFPNSMNGLRAVKALTDSRRKSKKIIRQGADKDGCQENAIICIAMGEL